jgi:hypothetical protein
LACAPRGAQETGDDILEASTDPLGMGWWVKGLPFNILHICNKLLRLYSLTHNDLNCTFHPLTPRRDFASRRIKLPSGWGGMKIWAKWLCSGHCTCLGLCPGHIAEEFARENTGVHYFKSSRK